MSSFRNIFFDRDGVINDVVIRDSLVSSPRRLDEFRIRNEFVEFHASLCRGDAMHRPAINTFVVSNQPDVARGLLSEEDLAAMSDALTQQFQFKEILCCTHDDSHACSCRKPLPGMIIYLLDKYGISAADSLLIGDSHKDILAGKAANVTTVLLRTSYNRDRIPSGVEPDFTVSNLAELFSLGLLVKQK